MKTLLLGNGLNRINEQSSWEHLLNELINMSRTNINNKNKPFPLLYEEILMNCLKNTNKTEDDLINIIIKNVDEIKNNELHFKYSTLTDNIITTNYDYTIENAILGNKISKKQKTTSREILYSLYRKMEVNNKKIWHIHGEINKPKSICLGYERYGANIQKTRNFIIYGDSDKKIDTLKNRLNNNNNLYISWVDYFFKEDIYIVGLGLDFHEIDLWWLLDFRAREKHRGNKQISNKIVYCCSNNEQSSRIDILKSLGVGIERFEIADNNYEQFYHKIYLYLQKKFI